MELIQVFIAKAKNLQELRVIELPSTRISQTTYRKWWKGKSRIRKSKNLSFFLNQSLCNDSFWRKEEVNFGKGLDSQSSKSVTLMEGIRIFSVETFTKKFKSPWTEGSWRVFAEEEYCSSPLGSEKPFKILLDPMTKISKNEMDLIRLFM